MNVVPIRPLSLRWPAETNRQPGMRGFQVWRKTLGHNKKQGEFNE